MEQFDTRYFRGQGPLFIEELDANGVGLGLHFIGDVSAASATPNIERFEIKENVSGVGRIGAAGIKSVDYEVAVTLRSIRKDALKVALRGLIEDKVGASVTDEAAIGNHSNFVLLKHVKVSAVVVTDETAVTTYTEGDDYIVHADEGMVEILATGTIVDGADLLIDYDYAAQHHIKVDPAQKYFRLVFAGMNTADSNKQTRAEFYKIQLDPSAINMITDDTEEHGLAGKVVHDTSRAAGDQLFSWKVED